MNQIDKFNAMQLSFDMMVDEWLEEEDSEFDYKYEQDFDTFEW